MEGSKELQRVLSLLLLLAFLPAFGCTGSLYSWQVRTSSTPMPQSFHPTYLNYEPVAIFEALGVPGLRGNEAGMAMHLAQVLSKVAPDMKVVNPQTTATRINQHGLEPEYALMRTDAEQSHILNRDILRKISAAIGARYVFLPRFASFSQNMQDRWKVPGFELRIVQTRSSVLRLSLQLWEMETGELVWMSVAEADMSNDGVTQDPVFMEEEIKVAFGGIIADFLYQRTSTQYGPLNEMLNDLIQRPPPPPPPQQMKEMQKK